MGSVPERFDAATRAENRWPLARASGNLGG
jgi:hypothetical protein